MAVKGHLKAILKGVLPSGKISVLKKINPFYGVIIFFIYKKFDSAILACSNNVSLFLFVHIEKYSVSGAKEDSLRKLSRRSCLRSGLSRRLFFTLSICIKVYFEDVKGFKLL
ncbi:hypothetical protein AVO42_00240 [Thiomicrospira sp. XS5]|nr:hypothetical protein AVO42_00240 [Thiomicrospira sp. XS5]